MKLFKRRSKPDAAADEVVTVGKNAESVDVVDKTIQVSNAVDATSESSSMFHRLRKGLSRSRNQFSEGLAALVLGKKRLDPDLFEALEEQLIMADLGLEATSQVLESLRQRLDRKDLAASETVMSALKVTLTELLADREQPLVISGHRPFVILVVGVNGAGKTTTIGKLAHRLKGQGHSVMLAAGDTFRAAAVEQLEAWGERNDVPVIAQHTGADSASVLYDALAAATARGIDVLIADTAGRLQNKAHLMDELAKVVRVMRKQDAGVPHETLLVLDAGTGQNAVSQAIEFDQTVGVTGIAVTKLDGTARGGVLFAIANRLARPIRYVGVGEQTEDLREFKAEDFVNALLET
jgi:fused signal recognition particle receptor